MGWYGSQSLIDAMVSAPCGCDLAEQADGMTDARGAAVLRADAVLCREAWRCPRAEGGAIDPDALPETHRAALVTVRRLTGCDEDDIQTCPGHYARLSEAHEAVRLLRWMKAGALAQRMPHPSGAIVDALDELQNALNARESDEMDRARRKSEMERPRG